jgi:lysine-N-methylase
MEKGYCSFLNKDGWCDIQTNLGEDYLCDTCSVYPRRNNKINEVVEQSLTVSCPEAARLVLLNESGIKFEIGPKEMTIKTLTSIANINNQKITHWTDFFNEYRYITISILQNRTYTLEERLLILGLLYNELDECVKKNNIKNIPDILGQYIESVDNYTFKDAFNNVSKRIDIHLRLCRELVLLRFNQAILSSRYLECSRDMLTGLKIEKDSTNGETQDQYEFSYHNYYVPFFKDKGYMLENYLVNYVFRNCMPINGDSPFESYSKMVLHYAIIKLHLVGMANHHKGLTPELVIKLIQSLSKTFEHNSAYFNKINNLMKENNFLSLTYMSILINN